LFVGFKVFVNSFLTNVVITRLLRLSTIFFRQPYDNAAIFSWWIAFIDLYYSF